MAELLVDLQSPPASPAAGQLLLFPHTSTKQLATKDENGKVLTVPGIKNVNTASVVASAADTYLTGSALSVPSHGLQVGTVFKWRIAMTKTAAGTAAPVWSIRFGTNGTTADTARLTFTGPAQTAAVDTGWVEITVVVQSISATGTVTGLLTLTHNLATTGFANIGSPTLSATSAAFDTSAANLIVGVSVNPGASGVWTHTIVKAEALNL